MPRTDIIMGLKDDPEKGWVRVHLMTCPTLFLFHLRKDHPRFAELLRTLELSMKERREVQVVMDNYSITDAWLAHSERILKTPEAKFLADNLDHLRTKDGRSGEKRP